MSILSDRWIKKMVKNHKMISPFISKQTRKGKISYGLDFEVIIDFLFQEKIVIYTKYIVMI